MSDSERVRAMTVEARGGPRAAEANEWLGRHLAEDDAFQAKLHLSEATRLAPGRAAAWIELARLVERGPHPREALDAWDQALRTTSDAARAEVRARRASLEACVLATRTPLDAVAQRIGASLPVPAHVDPIGRTQRYEPFVALCTSAPGHRRVHALVALSLMHGWVARVDGGTEVLVEVWEKDPNAIATASAHVAKGYREDDALHPLDAAIHVLEVLRREIEGERPWHLDTKTLWIDDGSARVVVRAAAPAVVHVSIDSVEADSVPTALACATHAELVAAEPAIVRAAREAAKENDAFRARPLGVRNVAPRLAAALRTAGIYGRSCVPAYRFGPGPSLASFAHEDVDLAMLVESRDALAITVGNDRLVARSYGEFERDLPAIVARALALVEQPLEPGIGVSRCYEVIAPFLDFAAGDHVKVMDSSWDHGDEHWFVTIATLSYPTRSIGLNDGTAPEVLAEPARFFRRIPSESVEGLVFD